MNLLTLIWSRVYSWYDLINKQSDEILFQLKTTYYNIYSSACAWQGKEPQIDDMTQSIYFFTMI